MYRVTLGYRDKFPFLDVQTGCLYIAKFTVLYQSFTLFNQRNRQIHFRRKDRHHCCPLSTTTGSDLTTEETSSGSQSVRFSFKKTKVSKVVGSMRRLFDEKILFDRENSRSTWLDVGNRNVVST